MTVSWLPPAMIAALGWALIHFLWQGAAIAALAGALMALCRRPGTRYWVGVGALALMLLAPVVTLMLFGGSLALPTNGFAALPSLPALPGLLPWVVEFWLGGVMLLSLRFAGGFLLLEKRQRRQSREARGRVLALALEVQQRLGLNRAIRYLECGWLKVPAVIGCIRPVMLLPVAALTGLSEAQLRAVIAHELAHVRRWDFLVNLFQIFAETLLFYHPAIWWLNRRIRTAREMCCDEAAVAEIGNRIAYADALVEYARALALMEEWQSAPAPAMAANHGILSERIFHILGLADGKSRIAGLAGSALLLAGSLALACVLAVPGIPVSTSHEILRTVAAVTAGRPVPPVEPEVRDAEPATTAPANNDYVIPRRNRLALIRSIRRPQVAAVSMPSLAAVADVSEAPAPDSQPPVPAPQPDAPPHQASIVAQELAAVTATEDEYPAPVLKLNASEGWQDWSHGEAIDYCKNFAVQTVTQGAKRPMLVDDGLKQRLSFFYWHCMLSNLQMVNAFGGDIGHGPAYMAVGEASPNQPVNVSGGWTLSIQGQASLSALLLTQAEAQSCNFIQSGNALSGTCAGRQGSGAMTGIIDGKQVRWVWKRKDGGRQAEVDFIGMVGADGAIAGQSIVAEDFGYRLIGFTAAPGPGQVASQR